MSAHKSALILATALRGGAAGIFLLTALLLILGDGRPTKIMWLVIAFHVSVLAHIVDHSVAWRVQIAAQRHDVVWFLAILAPPLLWAMLLNMFDDAKSHFWFRLVPAVFLSVASLISELLSSDYHWVRWLIYNAIPMALMAHVLWVMGNGIGDDLLESRRRMRFPVIVAAAIYVFWLTLDDRGAPEGLTTFSVIQAAILVALSLGNALLFVGAGPLVWVKDATPKSEHLVPKPAEVDPLDKLLAARLTRAMDQDEVWKQEGISIAVLARMLDVPEYRLRRLINERLGHRNFADFINSCRVTAAKAVLSNPEFATKAVSELAWELGFASLGPFNRAFKDNTGLSPTAWRLKHLADS
ncbi:MAG: helix-turn-helix domain-containing protein [Aquidulcibacter sp.]|nr:helix-turn-helix domain-containing protein [Aquidulcibacter sp.]